MNRTAIAKATALVTALTIGSKLLGFVRDQLIALYFGASAQTDAYVVAMTIPSLLSGVVIGAIGTAFLPMFAERLSGERREDAWVLSDSIFTLTGAVSLLLAAAGVAAAPWLVRLMAPGFDPATFRLAVTATRIIFPAMVFTALAAPVKSVLNSFHHFFAPAAASIVQNLIVLAALVGLVGAMGLGIEGLSMGLAAGMALSLLVQLPPLMRRGFRFRLRFEPMEAGVRRTLALAAPILAGALFSQVYVLVDRGLASRLPAGSIAALSFADKLRQLPLGIFAMAVATVIYPTLSEMAAKENLAGLKDTLGTGLRLVALVTLPAAFALAVLREPLVRLLFQHGAFDAAATAATAAALLYYAVGMVGLGANAVLTTTFFSLRDTLTPVLIGAVGTTVNIGLDYLLVGPLAHAGLALANSAAAVVTSALLLVGLRRKLGALGYRRNTVALGKIVVASLAMSGALVALTHLAPAGMAPALRQQASSLGPAVAVGALVYVVAVFALRVEEATMAWAAVQQKLLRRSRG